MGILLILGLAIAAFALMNKSTPGASGNNPSSSEVASAVQTALKVETDPNKLDEFADSLEPDYHDFANQLHARAGLLRQGGGGGAVQPAVYHPPPGVSPPPTPISPPPEPNPGPLPPPPPPTPVEPPPPAPSPVTPPPVAPPDFPAPGSIGYVTTHDSGPSGDLNVRSGPDMTNPVVFQAQHGSALQILGAPQNGWYPVEAASGDQGYASGQYLGASPPPDAGGGSGGGSGGTSETGS